MHRSILTAVLCLFSVSLVHAEPVGDLVSKYRDLRVSSARSASNVTITVGHATYNLPAGTVSPVLAGETPVGLFLAGQGTFRYESLNKDELSVLRFNSRHNEIRMTIGDESAVIEDSFTSVLLWGNDLPDIQGSSTDSSAQAAFDEHRDLFERGRLFGESAPQLFAYHALDDPKARLVRAEVRGKEFPFVHLYDGSHSHDETLTALLKQPMRTHRFKNTLYSVLLSRQAIGRGNRDVAPPRVFLTEVDIHLVGTKDDKATLTVVETLVPQKRAATALRFALSSTIYMETESRDRHYNLRAVTDEQGRKLSFDHDAGELVVGLAEPVAAGKPVKLRFEIDGDFLYRPENANWWELGITPWFPWVRDHEQAYRFHSVVKVEKPFVVFASGKTVRREEEGNYHVIETKIDKPVPHVAVLAGRYHFGEEERDGVMIRVASFMSKDEKVYKRIRDVAASAIRYYPYFLGEFPFDEITVIEKDSKGEFAYGQAPSGIVFITSEAFKPMLPELNEWVEGVNSRFAHEIAHMYFGNAVRKASSEEQWLDEAFAEYAAALFRKAGKKGAGEYKRELKQWRDEAKDAASQVTIPMANRLNQTADPYNEFLVRKGLIYSKGACLLAALHRELGDETFLTFLKSYQKSFRWKAASTQDVIGLLGFLTKKDYAPFFEKYYYGTAIPDVN